MISQLLIDSSFLFELYNAKSQKHRQSVELLTLRRQIRVIPDVVLTEAAYLLKARIGQQAVLNFLDSVDDPLIQIEAVGVLDLKRARHIMAEYDSASLDFVDCCIMALTERLNITQVCTFDRRDFSIFRPKHCEYLELLP